MKLSIVMPVLNEASDIDAALDALQPLRSRGHQLIVVDGGSVDDTPARAAHRADHVIAARRGRATQMNAGARLADGTVVMFLHADTRLPDDADTLIARTLAVSARAWGRFDVAIDGASKLFPVIAVFMNVRSRLSGIATGDQSIFVTREALVAIGGVPALALMEDVAMSKALKRLSRPACISTPVHTSGRRWATQGVVRTIVLMWALRFAYFVGVPPERLARLYYRSQSPA